MGCPLLTIFVHVYPIRNGATNMSDPILTLLLSEHAKERIHGLQMVAKQPDAKYLPTLIKIVKTDPVPEVQELAHKVGHYVQQQQKATIKATVPPPSPQVSPPPRALNPIEEDEAEELPTLSRPPIKVNRELAKVHYNTAFELHLQGQNAKAILELGAAFHLDPWMAKDVTAVKLASELTGVAEEQVALVIANPDNWRTLTERQGGLEKTKKGSSEATDQLIGWVLMGLVGVVLVALLVTLLTSDFTRLILEQAFNDFVGARTREF